MKQIRTFENCIQSIVAMEPCYGPEGGNFTRIYTRQGDVFLDSRRLKTLLIRLLKSYGYDLVELRSYYKGHLGCGQSVPLPISRNFVLAQLKMRQPLIENDGASGYVSVTDILKIVEEEAGAAGEVKCRLYLQGGLSVPCCFTRVFTEKRLRQGRLALDHYHYLHEHQGALQPQPLMVAEKIVNGSDLYERINALNSFVFQFLTDVKA